GGGGRRRGRGRDPVRSRAPPGPGRSCPTMARRARDVRRRGPWSAHPSGGPPDSGGGWVGGGGPGGRSVDAVPEVLVGRRGLAQRERRPLAERLDPHRTPLDVADRAQRAPAGGGVGDDLALHGASRE